MISLFRRSPAQITQSRRPGSVVIVRPGRRLLPPVVLHSEHVVDVKQPSHRRPWTRVRLARDGRSWTRWVHVSAVELDNALAVAAARLVQTSPSRGGRP